MSTDIEYIKSKLSISDYFNKVILKNETNYYGTDNIDFNGVGMVKCPLHDENTGSFRYFKDTESFYCFGCNRGGDVINLHRYYVDKLGSTMSLKDSIRYLKGLVDDSSLVDIKGIDKGISKVNSTNYNLTVEDYMALDKISKSFVCLDDGNLKAYKSYITLLNLIDLGNLDKITLNRTLKYIEELIKDGKIKSE